VPRSSACGPRAPVVFCFFNRPREAARVWETIRAARPARLYLVSDGARPGVAGEAERVRQCRRLVDSVDWPCRVEADYATSNMGCGARIASGLRHVFSREERAIVLEDDTVPSPAFFGFCDALLERYADHAEVLHVNGRNNLARWGDDTSYFFARRSNPWGWATWRRAWRGFDLSIEALAPGGEAVLAETLCDSEHAGFVAHTARRYAGRNIDTWDVQWSLSVLRRSGLCIVPRENLVRNIGFGSSGTHTHTTRNDMRAAIPASDLDPELDHPDTVAYESVGRTFDRFYFLFEQLNTYHRPGIMISLARRLAETPAEPLPRDAGWQALLPFLAPARYPAETRQLLEHLQRFIPDNATLGKLLGYF
jgi:hypothetical protein